jgi:hypothetical protein
MGCGWADAVGTQLGASSDEREASGCASANTSKTKCQKEFFSRRRSRRWLRYGPHRDRLGVLIWRTA